MSTPEVQQGPVTKRPEPTTLTEALARLNTTPDQAWALAVSAKWGFTPDGADSRYEYDQGDLLVVEYDRLYDLASIALAAMKLLGRPDAAPAPTFSVAVYAIGMVSCSACAPAGMAIADVEDEVNRLQPTGIESRWTKSAEAFASGESNPCVCENDPGRLHWLFTC